MSQQLISRSPDLKRLRDDGYDIEIRGAYLLLKDVPYVNANKEVKLGVLASTLTLAGDVTAAPDDHTGKFSGEYPCDQDGNPLEKIRHQEINEPVDDELLLRQSFSSKPRDASGPRGYVDYYEKMTAYVAILQGPAQVLDHNVSAQTNPVIVADDEESVFVYLDTASARAGLNRANKKLELSKVAIVGLGGTGSYILDLVAKTPVLELHLFDGDTLFTHNAFRAPGAVPLETLQQRPSKVSYFQEQYANMRRGIVEHPYRIDASNVGDLDPMDFVFLAMDAGSAKRSIAERLEAQGIPFIDAGIGVELADDTLRGIVRVTTSTTDRRDAFHQRVPLADREEDEAYDTNIQIADLNSLNAALAVIKWKKLYGFYGDYEHEMNSSYTIDCNMLLSEDSDEA